MLTAPIHDALTTKHEAVVVHFLERFLNLSYNTRIKGEFFARPIT